MDAPQFGPKIAQRNWTPSPFWKTQRATLPQHLMRDIVCDTVIVGAGITGLSIANSLADSQNVVVLDARRIGEGSSGWNAGILSVATTVDLQEVENHLGRDDAKALVASLAAVLERTKASLNLRQGIWQSGSSVYLAAKDRHKTILEDELSIRDKYELPSRALRQEQLAKLNLRGFSGGLELGHEHAVNPVELLLAMADAIKARGSQVFEDTAVHSWEHVDDRFIVQCGQGHLVQARNLVLATGMRAADFSESQELDRLLVPVVGHVFVTEPSPIIADMVARGGPIALWDSIQLYHYFRYLPDGRMLVGGEEIPGVVPGTVLTPSDPHIQRLYQWAQQHHTFQLPPLAHCWRASLVLPADGLPLIKYRRIGNNALVSAVTDGLPFGLLMGDIVARAIKNGAEDVDQALRNSRRLVLAAKLLKLLPSAKLVRNLAYKVAFAAMRIKDAVF